ncbi:uncharacterized protein LOC111025097 [Momordica charantia]|uniref:Uncharacterized protein LOC111025097 n=1 Tax=Momordica charantia TaxID=3673 RepID=A0A6J1DXR3_MOMCH|nr:uncharacterized protein LOC111025097 [Momordica charantia]
MEGLDFDETFRPVVKKPTIRVEDVFMSQPVGFIDTFCPDYVCCLHKSLYGLKQALRAWFERFTNYLITLGLEVSLADTSLFVRSVDGSLTFLLLYVDDIIITGLDSSYIAVLKKALATEFQISDFGALRYFLGLEIKFLPIGIFVNQAKYLQDLLVRSGMCLAKSCSTPMSTSIDLHASAPMFTDASPYRQLVGSLQYLTFTRSDITFSFNRNNALTLSAFYDADWAGDAIDRRSTTGFVAFLGLSPISWSTKKRHTMSPSSTEVEYRSLATTTADL